jgi:hypothetical protein
MISCSRDTVDVTYLVVRLDDVVMVEEDPDEEDPDEVEVVVGADEVELLMEELEVESVELAVVVGLPPGGELGGATGHVSTLTMLLSRVTVAPNAKTPPLDTAWVLSVTEVAARIFPWNTLPVPKVAELPTCQNTLHANPPPVSTTLDPDAVIREDPIWKYHASLAEPVPARVKVPVTAAEEP